MCIFNNLSNPIFDTGFIPGRKDTITCQRFPFLWEWLSILHTVEIFVTFSGKGSQNYSDFSALREIIIMKSSAQSIFPLQWLWKIQIFTKTQIFLSISYQKTNSLKD